jgi:hypothetical protein
MQARSKLDPDDRGRGTYADDPREAYATDSVPRSGKRSGSGRGPAEFCIFVDLLLGAAILFMT